MTMWQCNYHMIWATRERDPTIDESREQAFRALTIDTCRETNVLVHEIGIVADHVHLAVSIPPRLSVADVVQRIKGTTSRALGERSNESNEMWTGWQREYGVVTFSDRSVERVVQYVASQKEHLTTGNLWPIFETFERER